MKIMDMRFREYFEKYLVFACTWDAFENDSDEFPWPEEADGVLVYAYDELSEEISFKVLCPVKLKTMEYLVDKTPKLVSRRGFSMGGTMTKELEDIEIIVPDQDTADKLGLLSDIVHWGSEEEHRLLAATEIDPLRTPYNLNTFTVLIDCGSFGKMPARVRFEDYFDGVYRGELLDMLDDGIEIYENDTIDVRVEGFDEGGAPILVGQKEVEPEPRFHSPDITTEEQAALDLWVNGLGSSAKRFAGKDPMPPKHEKATKDSWGKLRDMPSRNESFYLGMEISPEEKAVLEYGHIPEDMGDHWFMYCEDNVIRYYRSWGGYCIFEATIEPCDDHYIIGEAKVNRYPGHYRGTNVAHDKYLLAQLVAWEIGRA